MSTQHSIDKYEVVATPYKNHDFVVHEAVHPTNGSRVFLKTGNPDSRDRKGVSASLTREAALLRRSQHPFVPRLFETVWHDHFPVIVMEKVEGKSLGAIAEEGPLSGSDWLKTIQALLDAVAWIHEQDVLHLDLHLENIIVGRDGLPRILDFGSATEMGYDRTLDRANPRTTAPELVTGTGEIHARCDVYSLGVIALVTALGEARFRELLPHVYAAADAAQRNRWMTLFRDSKSPFPSLEHECDGIVGLLGNVVTSMVAYDTEERPESISAVRSAIQSGMAGAGAGEDRSSVSLGDLQPGKSKHRMASRKARYSGQRNTNKGSSFARAGAVFIIMAALGLGGLVAHKFYNTEAKPVAVGSCKLKTEQLKSLQERFAANPVHKADEIRNVVQSLTASQCHKYAEKALKSYAKKVESAPVDVVKADRRAQLLSWVRDSLNIIKS